MSQKDLLESEIKNLRPIKNQDELNDEMDQSLIIKMQYFPDQTNQAVLSQVYSQISEHSGPTSENFYG